MALPPYGTRGADKPDSPRPPKRKSTARIKVFWTTDMARSGQARYSHVQQIRIVVATTSKVKARDLFSPDFNSYHSLREVIETGNRDDIAAAMAEPGTVYWAPLDTYGRGLLQKRTWRT